MNFGNIINNLLDQMTFFHPEVGNYVMIVVALVFLYLAIKKGFEPLLLVPTAFGMLLVNIYPDTMYSPEQASSETDGLLWYFFQLDEQGILPSLIFLDTGTMANFNPLIANPVSFLTGATTQLGVYSAYFFTILLGFSDKGSAATSIIGGVDGPTSLFLCSKLGQTQITGLIVITAYSYMALIPVIQPSFMKLLTTKKERRVGMEQLRLVSKPEKILFPIIVAIVVCLILLSTAPPMGILTLGNLFRESDVVKQLTDTASNALIYIVVILLGTSVGATTSAEAFLNIATIKIAALGLTASTFSTVGGVLLNKLLRKVTGEKINPLISFADVPVISMAARVSQRVGAEADPTSFLLMHAVRPNVAGVIGTTVAAGTFMAIFGV